MSIILQIADYQSIQSYLDNLKVFIRPEHFTPKSRIDIHSPLWAVYSSFNKNKIAPAEWGMVPNWDRKKQIPRPLTIARAETLRERVSYKSLIQRYRALIPVNAVIVRSLNKTVNNVYKYYRIKSEENNALALSALYQFNVDGNMQVVLITRSVKISQINKTLRLPLFVTKNNSHLWLNSEKSPIINSLLESTEIGDLNFQEVSP